MSTLPPLPDADDLAAMREVTMGNIEFDPTDKELRQFWTRNPHTVALALEWGWNDTEVRDQMCSALETVRHHDDQP